MSPLKTFRLVAIAEAVTWALLLTGMVLKYTDVTDLGVRVFGMVHGVVFIAYCLTTVLVAVDQRWSRGRPLLTLLASIPPFFTVLSDRSAEQAACSATLAATHEAPRRRSTGRSPGCCATRSAARSPAWWPSPR